MSHLCQVSKQAGESMVTCVHFFSICFIYIFFFPTNTRMFRQYLPHCVYLCSQTTTILVFVNVVDDDDAWNNKKLIYLFIVIIMIKIIDWKIERVRREKNGLNKDKSRLSVPEMELFVSCCWISIGTGACAQFD